MPPGVENMRLRQVWVPHVGRGQVNVLLRKIGHVLCEHRVRTVSWAESHGGPGGAEGGDG